MFLRKVGRMFFWKKKPKLSFIEQLEQSVNQSDNLAYIPAQIKANNQMKTKILPPQDPKYANKLTVVLELDQAISYTFTPNQQGYLKAPLRKYDFYTEYEEYDACLSIYQRKNLQNFINYLSEECEPVLWSTGVPGYVQIVMNFLDPYRKIPYRFSQQHCDLIENEKEQLNLFVKDLNLLGRDLSKVVYLDSKPLSYWLYPNNCYPIQQFRADMTMQGQDLNMMILELQALKQNKDVRPYLRERFKIQMFLKESKLL